MNILTSQCVSRGPRMICSKFNSTVLILACLFAQGCSQPRATVATDEPPQAEIELMFDRYIDTFSQAKWDAVDEFWHTPGWFATGTESVHLADDVAVQTFYRDLLQQLRQDGYSHSELLDSELEFFNASCALLRISYTRRNRDGEVMPPVLRKTNYLLLEKDGRWGINTMIAVDSGQS